MTRQLKTTHPTYQKVDKLMAFAEELGIHIDFNSCNGTVVVDKEFPEQAFYIHDLEEDTYNHSQVTYIPYGLEFKILTERSP